MLVKAVAVGDLQSNCYLYADEKNHQAAVIDPGADLSKIQSMVQGYRVIAILLTHGHFDHIGACADLAEKTGAPVYIGAGDQAFLTDETLNLAGALSGHCRPVEGAHPLSDGDQIKIGEGSLTVIATPGHTAGGVCFLGGDGVLFSGDTLFFSSIGRTDFPTGDLSALLRSIRTRLAALPDSTVVYPGHGPKTTMGREKAQNPYLQRGGEI